MAETALRLDKWLWYARFCKSRSLASKLCRLGRVRVNRQIVHKPNHEVRPGDVLTFALGKHVRVIGVVALGERRGPAAEARTLYTDLAPPPAREAAEARIITSGRRLMGSGRPTKRDRRQIVQLIESGRDKVLGRRPRPSGCGDGHGHATAGAMLSRLKTLFQDGHQAPRGHAHDEIQLAAAALMVEAALLDERFDDAERSTIRALVMARFELDEGEADELLAAADREADGSVQLHRFARIVKDHFDHDERVELIAMLWEVVYADGVLHDYEASLLRRIAGLIYVSDRECGIARQQVLRRLGLTNAGGAGEE